MATTRRVCRIRVHWLNDDNAYIFDASPEASTLMRSVGEAILNEICAQDNIHFTNECIGALRGLVDLLQKQRDAPPEPDSSDLSVSSQSEDEGTTSDLDNGLEDWQFEVDDSTTGCYTTSHI